MNYFSPESFKIMDFNDSATTSPARTTGRCRGIPLDRHVGVGGISYHLVNFFKLESLFTSFCSRFNVTHVHDLFYSHYEVSAPHVFICSFHTLVSHMCSSSSSSTVIRRYSFFFLPALCRFPSDASPTSSRRPHQRAGQLRPLRPLLRAG